MWRITTLTALLYILNIEGKPMELLPGPLWRQSLTSLSSPKIFRRSNPDILKQWELQRKAYSTDSEDEMDVLQFPPNKRALAMIARWGPFSSIGKERTPIRSSFIDPATNINTQTRGRMAGQPLRWG